MTPLVLPVCRGGCRPGGSRVLHPESSSAVDLGAHYVRSNYYARVGEEQRLTVRLPNEEEARRPDEVAIEIDDDEEYDV